METKVVGVTFPNPDGSDRQAIVRNCRTGDRVTLKREWGNDYDPNSIAVHSEHGQIGYVPARVAAQLVRIGFEHEAMITDVWHGSETAPTAGAKITINAGRQHGSAASNGA